MSAEIILTNKIYCRSDKKPLSVSPSDGGKIRRFRCLGFPVDATQLGILNFKVYIDSSYFQRMVYLSILFQVQV